MNSQDTVLSPRKRVGALVVLAIAQFNIALDYGIVYIALPSIGADLQLSVSVTHWVISGYAVFFAGFLIVGGRATDRFGPRRVFVWSLFLFSVASVIGGVASNAALLLTGRGLLGVAAAALQPSILALINTSFPAGKERNRAMSVWGTIGASGLAIGVVLGGLLTLVSWRWVFFINIPFAVVCIIAAPRLLPARPPGWTDRSALNLPSAALCTATVLTAALTLTQAAEAGWTSAVTIISGLVALALLIAFVVRERRSIEPLIDPIVRRTRTLIVGCGATALYMASVGNQFYVVTLMLQEVRGYGPLVAGLAFLPMAAFISVGNLLVGPISARFSLRTILTTAFAANVAGLLLLAGQANGSSYVVNILPGLVVSGIGHGITYVAMFLVGLGGIKSEKQGIGSALMTTAQYMSGALGIAVLVLVMGSPLEASGLSAAFVTTAIAAALGAALAWFGLRGTTADGIPGACTPTDEKTGSEHVVADRS